MQRGELRARHEAGRLRRAARLVARPRPLVDALRPRRPRRPLARPRGRRLLMVAARRQVQPARRAKVARVKRRARRGGAVAHDERARAWHSERRRRRRRRDSRLLAVITSDLAARGAVGERVERWSGGEHGGGNTKQRRRADISPAPSRERAEDGNRGEGANRRVDAVKWQDVRLAERLGRRVDGVAPEMRRARQPQRRAHGERREDTLGEDDVEGARRVARGGEHRAADGRRDDQGAARRAALERAAGRERADEAAEQEEEAGLPLDRRDRRRPVAVGVAARARGVQRVHRQHEEDARGLAHVERGERQSGRRFGGLGRRWSNFGRRGWSASS